ncbi:methyltransferase domain-containing protein [Streptantibioticus rubrisoli]|uniref:Methyltransferase domain-containing protein n=1 Tax=Streptantibioticus rubrisoli TaxID=1387313 RepID=A0ABT1P748_9ACTN|nr:methyltransferase domain-containing protein [Streptantibioticus rubrisoli]MCQ4041180.1 methyltransferase domain-containing protein [Streptantibioticus rubrisoli]
MTQENGYLLDNRQREAGRRFDAFAGIFDPWTLGHLERVGLTAGWRCWEVGAGGTSVPTALAERVGTTGLVLATDIDTCWLTGLAAPVEVRRHDVVREEPPGGGFDLVHARLVLVHLPTRAEVLRRLAAAVRPGGWLVVEDADPALQPLACLHERGPVEELANRIRRGFRTLLAQRGVDLSFGRTLPALLRGAGLRDVRAEGYFPVTSPDCRELEAATVRQLREQLVGNRLATESEIDQHLANLDSEELDVTTAPLITCWGRRPA